MTLAGQTVGFTDLPQGNYVAIATVQSTADPNNDVCDPTCDTANGELSCTMYHDGNFMGYTATDFPPDDTDETSTVNLSINGGAVIGAGGGRISVECSTFLTSPAAVVGQVVVFRIGGFI